MTDYLAKADEHLKRSAASPAGVYPEAARQHLDIAREYIRMAVIEKGVPVPADEPGCDERGVREANAGDLALERQREG